MPKQTWVFNPKKKPLVVPDQVKSTVTKKFDALVKNVLKPRYVKPPPKDQRFNYLIDISTKWHRQFFYVNGKFFCPGPNQRSPTFETGFVRLEYVGAISSTSLICGTRKSGGRFFRD